MIESLGLALQIPQSHVRIAPPTRPHSASRFFCLPRLVACLRGRTSQSAKGRCFITICFVRPHHKCQPPPPFVAEASYLAHTLARDVRHYLVNRRHTDVYSSLVPRRAAFTRRAASLCCVRFELRRPAHVLDPPPFAWRRRPAVRAGIGRVPRLTAEPTTLRR